MKNRHSSVVMALALLSSLVLSACASKAPQEKSAADAMRAQQAAASDPRACYDEFGYRRADVPYAFCRDQPQYYVVEERRPAPREPSAVEGVSQTVQEASAVEPLSSESESAPARSVVRPTARSQPLPRPGIGVMRLPVPVTGGIGVLR